MSMLFIHAYVSDVFMIGHIRIIGHVNELFHLEYFLPILIK